jgi:hypothetical protein
MSSTRNCCFLFFDYTDFDVFLNARIFYRLAGYQLTSTRLLTKCDLLVYFRGHPDRIYTEYKGIIHFYDYVCEHELDLSKYFPNASEILGISIHQGTHARSLFRCIYGYLPVIPHLWQFRLPFTKKTSIPIHVSNYKPLVNDPYQNQLVSLIQSGKVHVYGAKWDRVNISSRPLSYLQANLRLASSLTCFGLMYPYQRGKSLSGRMWQGPIQGCVVISEETTNLFCCPGIIEVSRFDEIQSISEQDSNAIAIRSTEFWINKTEMLATDLNLFLNWKNLSSEVIYCRLLLICQHNEFLWKTFASPRIINMRIRSWDFLRKAAKWISSK